VDAGSASAAPAVSVRDLVKRFPRTLALAGISFEVRPGEVLGLLGLIRPTAGSVRLFGRDPHDGTKAALARVAFASPEALMDWRLTVEENLRVYAGLYGVPRAGVARALETLELTGEARTRFGDLSLGLQTRAGLARPLLRDPDLLVLDEPTSSLDPDIADKTRRFLLEVRRERGLSILYTSHNM